MIDIKTDKINIIKTNSSISKIRSILDIFDIKIDDIVLNNEILLKRKLISANKGDVIIYSSIHGITKKDDLNIIKINYNPYIDEKSYFINKKKYKIDYLVKYSIKYKRLNKINILMKL